VFKKFATPEKKFENVTNFSLMFRNWILCTQLEKETFQPLLSTSRRPWLLRMYCSRFVKPVDSFLACIKRKCCVNGTIYFAFGPTNKSLSTYSTSQLSFAALSTLIGSAAGIFSSPFCQAFINMALLPPYVIHTYCRDDSSSQKVSVTCHRAKYVRDVGE
jgi:hypothetical protein